jgi:hypothetical protein
MVDGWMDGLMDVQATRTAFTVSNDCGTFELENQSKITTAFAHCLVFFVNITSPTSRFSLISNTIVLL